VSQPWQQWVALALNFLSSNHLCCPHFNVLTQLYVLTSFYAISSPFSCGQARSSTGLTRDEVALTGAIMECIPVFGLSSPDLVECLFHLLLHASESSLRIAVFLTFRKMASLIPQGTNSISCRPCLTFRLVELEQHEKLLAVCLTAPEGYVRELAIKIMRIFGSASLTRCTPLLLACLGDPEPFVKKQAVKALSQLVTEESTL